MKNWEKNLNWEKNESGINHWERNRTLRESEWEKWEKLRKRAETINLGEGEINFWVKIEREIYNWERILLLYR